LDGIGETGQKKMPKAWLNGARPSQIPGKDSVSLNESIKNLPEEGDFINDFMVLTEHALSPEIFRLWSGIAAISGALERRVWARAGDVQIFPNQFIWLVGPPAIGKYIIEDVNSLWREVVNPTTKTPILKVGPSNMTKASLMDELSASYATQIMPKGPPLEYSSLQLGTEEVGVFLPEFDMEFIGVMNKIWNNPPEHSETRRTGKVLKLSSPFPQINWLAGVQPGWMGMKLPMEVWTTGLARRLIMIYSAEEIEKDLFISTPDITSKRAKVLKKLKQYTDLTGEFQFNQEAIAKIRDWWKTKCSPQVDHPRLDGYNRTRKHHQLKLALVSAVARGSKYTIELPDVERSLDWLFEAEARMPDIFRAMKGNSDEQVMDELHIFAIARERMKPGKSIPSPLLWDFLRSRVPSDRIEKIIFACERAGMIERIAGTEEYKAKPRINGIGI
jgi:hypothetical protein